MISVIIPTYNEEEVITDCLQSLLNQSHANFEIIVVDDGSTDSTIEKVKSFTHQKPLITILLQKHLGAGAARNLGAKQAKGDILVFVDADMTFDKNFVKDLTDLIISGKAIGTYSTNEKLLNTDNQWAVCWNLNFSGKVHEVTTLREETITQKIYHFVKKVLEHIEKVIAPISHKNVTALAASNSHLPYRAILKSSFESVGGFSTNVGYTDDWTLAEKLNKLPTPVNAKYYHRSPSTIDEIWKQARWIGKDELQTGNIVRKIKGIIVHNPISSLITGTFGAIRYRKIRFILFRLIYSFGIFVSVVESFFVKLRSK